ncbi:putative nucleic acid-binding Zn ribbon protein [Motilibacter peucedani]|uniref:UPF0232 protein CLV35_0785 n=1 Tax=Motilibacter peucedani TaxID=598650 RepID=A0A420XU50_9ACTN|nr:DciA family protein [Motilibacter peucedani]RKS80354.1 putative nucleic acid-binding Zn ribbon protein [Motilibacter peucedani]
MSAEPPPGAGDPAAPAEVPDPADLPPVRSGVDVARQALAAARAEARRRGLRRGTAPAAGGGLDGPPAGRTARRRPVDEVRSGPRPDDRDPQAFSRAVDRLVRDRGWELDAAVGALLGRWDAVVGADVAAHATPESFEDGVLTVRASSTAWATELRDLVPAIQARIAAELGRGVCTSIKVLGPAAPSWRKGPLTVRGRGPRDTYG